MIRQIFTAESNTLTLALPEAFLGKRIEVIAFPVEDDAPPAEAARVKTFNALKLDTRGYKFDREEANER